MPPPLDHPTRRAPAAITALVLAATAAGALAADAELPTRLSAAGAPMPGRPLPAGVATFTPQYPLWSDGSARAAVLGFAALQLSPDRDPLITRATPRPGDVDLRSVAQRGWLRGLPAALLADAPRVAATTPVERAALGYLHGNCAHCHNTGDDRAPVRLTLAMSVADPVASRDAVLRTLVDAASRWRASGSSADARVVVAGRPDDSTLFARMHSRDARAQMPPLGSDAPDPEGLALVQRWIEHHLAPTKELQP